MIDLLGFPPQTNLDSVIALVCRCPYGDLGWQADGSYYWCDRSHSTQPKERRERSAAASRSHLILRTLPSAIALEKEILLCQQ